MGRQIRPARVYQNAATRLTSNVIFTKPIVPPPWALAIESIPPTATETREYPVQHQDLDPRQRRPRNLYRPTRISYPEDELRRTFYKDHPWELARPRIVLELDGKDSRYWDWSKGLRQPQTPLTGECVVQRQLWLMENENLSKEQAYDKARREFYRLRNEEDVERRIAQEEARMVGAYFGKNTLQVSKGLEDHQLERWKAHALEQITKFEAMRAEAYTSFGDEEAEEFQEEGAPPLP